MARPKIGRYEIRNQLGEGGMGTVYLAYDPTLGREVAIKVLQPHLYMHDPDFSVRFEREAKAVATLEHGGIVSLYDFGAEDEWLYYVMRLMKGGTLKQRIARGPLNLDETVSVLRRIGGALDKAHRRGIVHRDLKPGNILFDEDGDAYLSDFGIVKMDDTTGLRTRTGQILGTPQYMSPEQLDGKEIDGRSDIYSLGVVLYEMLSGTRPYDDESEGRVIAMHYTLPVPNIAEANPILPPGLQPIINKAMAKDPAERYTSVSELTAAVSAIAAARFTPRPEPEPITRPVPVDDSAKSGGISKWVFVLAGLALIFFMIVGGIAFATYVSGNGSATGVGGEEEDRPGEVTETVAALKNTADPEAVAATNEAAITTAVAATVAADPASIAGTEDAEISMAVAATTAAESESMAAAAQSEAKTATKDAANAKSTAAAAATAAESEAMAATAEAAAAKAATAAAATTSAELASECISANTWTPSGSGSIDTDRNNCLLLSPWGIEAEESTIIIDAARPSSEEINGIFSQIDEDVTIEFDVKVDRLTSPGDDILTNVAFGILPSHLPENFGHIYYQQESPQAGYPTFVKHKERGGFEEYMTLDGEFIRYTLGTVDRFTMSLVRDELNIFRNGMQVAGPIDIDFADRFFWIGYRLPVGGAIEATISNLKIEE
ncbi:MAG: protein kinase [Chloroflexi bacterium]|jgi:tRNA A-37 threonylcarbamoyl transferase component Bud32|nr:protein kinase [Chloroflexota bacterium]